MIAGESTAVAGSRAQGAARPAPGLRGSAQDLDQLQAEESRARDDAGTASFAQLIALMRTSSLPGADTSAKEEGTPSRLAKAKVRGAGAQLSGDELLAGAAINPTNLAEKELRTAPNKGEGVRESVEQRQSQRKDDKDERGVEVHTDGRQSKSAGQAPIQREDKATSHPRGGGEQAHKNAPDTPMSASPFAGQPITKNPSASTESKGVGPVSAVGLARGPTGQQQTSAVNTSVTAQRAASSRAFINKLAHAATPTRAQVQQKQVADAAARGLGIAIKKGGGEVTMRLRPEGLGQLRVDLRLQGSTVEASLRAQTDSARGLLVDSLPLLKTALEAQGLTVERIVVEPGGAPAPAQDARHAPLSGTEAQAMTPDGSGQSSRDDQEARSALGTASPGGDWAESGTDAQENQAPLWADVPASMTSVDGAWEWVA